MPFYWVVDGDEHAVEVWTPADDFPAVERDGRLWNPAGASAPFSLNLTDLFRPR